MAQLPPGIPGTSPPPPSWLSHPSLPPPPSPPSVYDDKPYPQGRIVADVAVSIVASYIVLSAVYTLFRRYHNRRARAAAVAADKRLQPLPEHGGALVDERQPRQASAPSPTACPCPPAFAYSPSVKHNLRGGGGDEAATCSVCLGEFQLGETVRLLPVCLHLYHADCIDPWLDAHSTCPLCRSGTEQTTDSDRLPPV
uniref:Uncharacterized protein n=1 Tax=Avena sativa TaxID=4498 RepID=A0ACD6A9Q1_AVESA